MEAIGAASAILQIATAGIQCTVKLVALAGQMRTAPERINHIAEDISLNASILQQLGELIRESKGDGTSQQDDCSEEQGHKVFKSASLATDRSLGQKIPEQGIFNASGLETTLKLASRCSRLFDSLSESLRNASQQLESKTTNAGKIKLSRAERLKWPFLKPEMDTIRDELKDIKGTLMLMLQVAMLAYSRNMTQSDNANKTTIITYSEEDQHLLVRSIVAAHRSRQTPRISGAQTSTTIVDLGRTEPVNPRRESESLDDGMRVQYRGSESTTKAPSSAAVYATMPENQKALPPASYRSIETAQAPSPQLDSCEQSVTPQEAIHDAVNLDLAALQWSEHTEPAKSVRQMLDGSICHDEESSGVATSKPQLYERSLPSRQSSGKSKVTEYLIRVLSPQASLYKNKIHVVYQARLVRPSPSTIETQIQQWRSSQSTLVDQLLQLTPEEHSALDAIESLSTEVSHLRPKNKETIEWIHLGEYFPVIDGLDQIKARVISIITTQWRLAPVDESDLKPPRPVHVHSCEGDYGHMRSAEMDHFRSRPTRIFDEHSVRRRHSLSDLDSKAYVQPNGKGDDIDGSLVYIHKTYGNEDHARHRSYFQEGALVGLGAEELLRNYRRREDEGTSDGMSRIGRDVGAGTLGPTAVLAASRDQDYYRSRSLRRSSRSRARSPAELGLGAAEIAGAVAFARNRANDQRRSFSRGRSRSRQRHISLVSGAASEDEDNEMDDSINGDDIVQDLITRYTTL
ncbi:hypothetical protein SI65_00002 [Aspergillus cristatus]|uniref:Fungal N-terminal domain-containing protein n=1 Tax=Aspergillus cristatus TaxID=573508 RepID=A0A1E3BN66_ASPCR|nr:hypothetical protein SI65_00002 [Aspergillus cristatus]